MRTTSVASSFLLLALSLCFVAQLACGSARSAAAPKFSDVEFWNISTTLSEAPGAFPHSDTLVSNEIQFVQLIRLLRPGGGVYIGVGPEQNFSYIARLRPGMAFIIDIRRENRNLHLMYKALFEMAADRADFVSRLFSRERPASLRLDAPVQELFEAYELTPRSGWMYGTTIRQIRERLLHTHRFPLTPADLAWIDRAFDAFYSNGPEIQYGGPRPGGSAGPSYDALMTAKDVSGQSRSFLATEDAFAFVKDLQARNAIVPLVGDFGGQEAMLAAGDFIRRRGAIVTAFYSSNVEVYLNRQQAAAFCRNLAALPHDSRTWFIVSNDMRRLEAKLKACAPRVP